MNFEELGLWFLRLNGFFTLNNFVVHPRTGTDQRTDIDVLGVRFPHRRELVEEPLQDHASLSMPLPQIVLAEIKSSRCSINGPWITPDKQNMQNVLYAVGAVPWDQVDDVSSALYREGVYESGEIAFRFLCIGRESDPEIASRFPRVPQILWSEVELFIFERFTAEIRRKRVHPQWDPVGKHLWDTAVTSKSVDEFRFRVYERA